MIAGFAAAAEGCATTIDLAGLRDRAEQAAMQAGGAAIMAGTDRLPNTAAITLPGVPAETQVIALDLAGIAVSAGAACSSGKVARSHVLDAMGLEAAAGQTIRVSLAWNTTQADIAAFADAYRAVAARLLRRNA